jgi:hypothetical protein
VELGGRATRAWMEQTDARAGTVVWRQCCRAAFIGRGRLAGATEERSRRRWVLNSSVSTLIRGGESMGRRGSAGEGRRPSGVSIQLHPSAGGGQTASRGAVATDRTGGGGSGGRWKTAGLTDRVGPPINEGEATGRLGQKEREEMGRGWARKEERRPGRNYFLG